ncbi:ubiquitin-conjugating enzyme E2 25-like [Liolophura sinensis]|uniref:ubiquitin-conjugating enzyme E2 25-like n=1 Tax=Liolophura sinensis TaxID=3198878 RepID=UPI0031590299
MAAAPDFSSIKSACEKWLASQKSSLQLLTADNVERRLDFILPSNAEVSFYLVCSEDQKTQQWRVWSEQSELIPVLLTIQDSLGSCKQRSVEEVLQLVMASLKHVLGTEAVGQEDIEDKDEGLEDDDDADDDADGDDDDDDVDIYYPDEDTDALRDSQLSQSLEEGGQTADDFFTGDGSPIAVQRLLKDLKYLSKDAASQYGISGSPKNENLFIWDVKLTDIPKDTRLGKDLHAYAVRYNREPVVTMEMKFPSDYPMSPPFVRVIRPRFKFLTGHVTVGGSICMEMLTRSGWRPTNDIESILIQIRCEILSDPNASLDSNPDRAYDETEAKTAFERMVTRYGWNR